MPAAARASPLDMAVVSADEASSEPDEAAGRVEVSLAVFIKAKDGLLTRRGRRTVCGARRRGRPAGSRARTGATGNSIRGRADGSRADDASDHGGRLADGPAETVSRARGRAASCGRPARSCSSSRSGRPGVRGCARSSAPDRAGASGGRSCGAGSGGGRCAGSSRSGLRGKCTVSFPLFRRTGCKCDLRRPRRPKHQRRSKLRRLLPRRRPKCCRQPRRSLQRRQRQRCHQRHQRRRQYQLRRPFRHRRPCRPLD